MELNRFEKIIAVRNLREGLEQAALGIFDRQHLAALHDQMCQHFTHKQGLAPGQFKITSQAVEKLSSDISDSSKAVLSAKSPAESADHLASVLVKTSRESPFASFNKEVAMLMTDGIAKSSGVAIDWKKIDPKELSNALGGFNPELNVAKMLEGVMLPKENLELSPLERRETHYRRQPVQSNDPSLTARTYLLG